MGLYPFYSFGETVLEKSLKILSLISWALGGCVYIYNLYEAIEWTRIFPQPSELGVASWLMAISLRFLALWMPMALLLVHWRIKRVPVLIGYIIGCAIAVILSIAALAIIQTYREDGYLRKQYFKHVNNEMKAGFPEMIKRIVKSDLCCSWYGPTDFGTVGSTFNIDSKKDKDLAFMQSVAECAGNVFKVEINASNNGLLSYSPSQPTVETPPEGCGQMYKRTANRLCNYITFMTVIITILSAAFIALYTLNYKQIDVSSVSPAPEQPQNWQQMQQETNEVPGDD